MKKAEITRALMQALQTSPFDLPVAQADNLEFQALIDASERLSLRNACACANARVRAAADLDLSPDVLLLDFGLGTIGLVHVLEPAKNDPLAEQAKRHVDQATYLRHLLITEGVDAGTSTFRVDYTVECVLAVEVSQLNQMVQAVRELAGRTRFLHATGLNLLPIQADGSLDPRDVQRAFAWLLPATRQRLTECTAPAGARLSKLVLTNYRLPGERPWKLSEYRVHLLHGANGTGKSSIAESLELVVTGAVERIRLHPQPDYAKVIRNSGADADEAPVAQVEMSDGTVHTYTVNATGVAETPLAAALPVSAFRLDQVSMDQLVRADSQQRARALTRAFFPGDAYDTLEQAQREFSGAYRDLPLEVRTQLQSLEPDPNKWHTAVETRLKWVAEESAVPAENVAECLPLPLPQLIALAKIVPEISDALNGVQPESERRTFDASLGRLDEALERVRSDARRYRDAVVRSLAVLRRLATWAPSSEEVAHEYSDVLRDWSDRVALADLLQKHLEVSKTLLAARGGTWSPDAQAPGLLAVDADVLQKSLAGLTEAAGRCATEQRAFFNQLRSTDRPAGDAKHAPPATLTVAEIADLNVIGGWFARLEPTPPAELFGDAIQKAVSENVAVGYGSLTIGAHSWAARPVDFLAPLEAVLNDLIALDHGNTPPPGGSGQPVDMPVYRSGVSRMNAYREALVKSRKLAGANRLVEAALMNRLTEHKLNEALDEVITLFTPARWAYEGLFVSTRVSDGKVGVDLLTARTQSPAEVRLNTAELNLVILALYLLCGPTIQNPLGTLILDDPLQNMDELTAATVARGMAKVAALLPDGWQLLLMFHGDEDLETFRREVPAGVYRLPWLGPIGVKGPSSNEVRVDMSKPRVTMPKTLAEVMERRVSRGQGSGVERG